MSNEILERVKALTRLLAAQQRLSSGVIPDPAAMIEAADALAAFEALDNAETEESPPVEWSRYDAPDVLARGLRLRGGAREFTRLCKDGSLTHEKLTTKKYRIAMHHFPDDETRDKMREHPPKKRRK